MGMQQERTTTVPCARAAFSTAIKSNERNGPASRRTTPAQSSTPFFPATAPDPQLRPPLFAKETLATRHRRGRSSFEIESTFCYI